MTEKIHKAHCMCGEITMEARGKPNYVEYCHCITCQQSAGSSYIVWVFFDKNKVKVTKGKLTFYQSSSVLKRGFCGNCGSSMAVRTDKCFDITLGVMDNPDDFEINQHIWAKRAIKHVNLDDDLPCFTEDAPD